MKLEGIQKLWGKEGYLPKKESKTGDETEAPPVPQESIMENVDQTITKKNPSQVLTQSKEEKEKQLLASSLFVGLGSESTVNLVSSQLCSSESLCPLFHIKKILLYESSWPLCILVASKKVSCSLKGD